MIYKLSLIALSYLIGSYCSINSMESKLPKGPVYEPVASRSSSSSSDEGPEHLQAEIDAISSRMKQLRDHLRFSYESYETGKQIDAINQHLNKLSVRIGPRFFRQALEMHHDQIKGIVRAQCKLFLDLAKKEQKTCNDGDTETKRYLGHAFTNKIKIKRFCAELKDRYGLFATSLGVEGTGNSLLE